MAEEKSYWEMLEHYMKHIRECFMPCRKATQPEIPTDKTDGEGSDVD